MGFIAPALLLAMPASAGSYVTVGFDACPHDYQVRSLVAELGSAEAKVRAGAAEALGFLRAYGAGGALARALGDDDAEVRRNAALSLAWCGGREELAPLVRALDDRDWSVRQAAWVALTNLTGMEFPFDALARGALRAEQVVAWRQFVEGVPPDGAPPEVLALLGAAPEGEPDLAAGCAVSASSTYKGPPSLLTDPAATGYWQTKRVPFPQHCTVDLGAERTLGCVQIDQFRADFCMTDCDVSVSLDGKVFERVWQASETPMRLVATFDAATARYVRVTSRGSRNPAYPTTFYRVRVYERAPKALAGTAPGHLNIERGLRALGSFGGPDAGSRIAAALDRLLAGRSGDMGMKLAAQAGIRSLGRVGDQGSLAKLGSLLGNAHWARYAADALADSASGDVARALIDAYPTYARDVAQRKPKTVPPDDRPGFESVDRAYETPHAIASALSRMPLEDARVVEGLRRIAPLLVANLPGDFDGAMLYEPEGHELIVAYLLERAGLREEVRDVALEALGVKVGPAEAGQGALTPEQRKALLALGRKAPGGTSVAATWLPALSRPGERTREIVGLLDHANGWVRINAAKTLMFTGERSAVSAIAERLGRSRSEASYGYLGKFLFKVKRREGQDEYNAPSPCWREAFARALGDLGGSAHAGLLTKLLDDEESVLEVRYAAAVALDCVGGDDALAALRRAEAAHPFHSVRLVAREALWRRGITPDEPPPERAVASVARPSEGEAPGGIVFIKGANEMPNDFQIDIWRQTYSTTDSGPTYRLGKNLYSLAPAQAGGTVTQLTEFTDGYVADCETSWDGTRVLFARRGGDADPWWHVFEMNSDGSGLRRLTRGPYHDVQPAYLPDGRIVFSTTRVGLRDEYHGYPATGLAVMGSDGSDIRCIGFNLGRDHEPAVLPDGRIVFSRLDLFYSRLKTEITVQAAFPDGTKNVTLYGPERRDFWRQVTRDSRERWWFESPPRHRVLRLTQPQPFGRDRVMCASSGGPVVVGPGRMGERIVPGLKGMAVTSMYPLDEERVLCAATKRTFKRSEIDLGLYMMDPRTGEMTLLYNDPATAEFEPRPLTARRRPPVLAGAPRTNSYVARLVCGSALTSREALTRERGRLVRIVEGRPVPSRHHTHTNSAGQAWKNHVGTHARVLGTVPLAADGSFYVEVPADRLIHCQVLDSDRRVVGNQLVWMYARPGETRSCVGCHEAADSAPPRRAGFALSATRPPLPCLPTGGEFSYRAKAWKKGTLPPEVEERTRTVRAVNFVGRH
jgi:HEAT repeat protein